MTDISYKLIEHLIEIKAIELRPNQDQWFTWASGIRSPIYCDNRMIISYPQVRKLVAQAMVQIIKDKYPQINLIAGTSTAGIPHAAWVSDILDLPMVYVRGSAKSHGKTNQIEGKATKGQKVVIIEDLISTGKSSINVAKSLKDAGLEVLGVVAIFGYNLNKAIENFQDLNLEVTTITNYDKLITQAQKSGLVDHQVSQILIKWRDQL